MVTHKSSSQIIPQAATVILTREKAGKLQVYLLKRSSKSGFMAGNFVFPGGTVEIEDRHFNTFINHSDLNKNRIVSRLGGDLSRAQTLAFCVAAIRETLEEAGVFLAHRIDELEASLEQVHRLRMAGNLEKDWFTKFVKSARCRLALTTLSRWSHWVTPKLMKRRFDTRFFLATMPSGQFCRPDFRETVQGLWIAPQEGMEGNLNGRIPLSPPTLVTLQELLKYQSLKELQAETKDRQWGQTLLPRMVPLANGAIIVEPWDPMYRQKELDIAPDDLAASVLNVGEPFSRIWHNEGIWKPVGVVT